MTTNFNESATDAVNRTAQEILAALQRRRGREQKRRLRAWGPDHPPERPPSANSTRTRTITEQGNTVKTHDIPRITLNDGTTIPQLGFGTLNVQPDRRSTPANIERTAEVVGLALQLGYRHIDMAQSYGNEQGVGKAIAASGIPRDELYVTSKLSNGHHRPDDVRRSFDETLEKLGLERLDLFLVHWPVPTLYDGDYVSTWKAMTELVACGRLRTAGVSNFQSKHLDRIIAETGMVPAVKSNRGAPVLHERRRSRCFDPPRRRGGSA